MGKYLKKFEKHSDYEEYIGNNPILPNISYCKDENYVHLNDSKTFTSQVGEIAYWDGSNIAFTPYSAWTSSLGTPIGVCVIPKTHHGKARYISVKGVNPDGTASDTEISMVWGPIGTDTPLTNYTTVPTWDNTIGGTVGTSSTGYISSDDIIGTQNAIDTKTYYSSTPYIPSPYSTDESLNANYNVEALSDLDGKSNTVALAKLGGVYEAAVACSKYCTDGTHVGDWYLPAAGELAYIMPRLKIINEALTKCDGVIIDYINYHLTSTEYDHSYVYTVDSNDGGIKDYSKDENGYVRPFSILI